MFFIFIEIAMHMAVDTSGFGKLFHSLVVEHTNEFAKVLEFIREMENDRSAAE